MYEAGRKFVIPCPPHQPDRSLNEIAAKYHAIKQWRKPCRPNKERVKLENLGVERLDQIMMTSCRKFDLEKRWLTAMKEATIMTERKKEIEARNARIVSEIQYETPSLPPESLWRWATKRNECTVERRDIKGRLEIENEKAKRRSFILEERREAMTVDNYGGREHDLFEDMLGFSLELRAAYAAHYSANNRRKCVPYEVQFTKETEGTIDRTLC